MGEACLSLCQLAHQHITPRANFIPGAVRTSA